MTDDNPMVDLQVTVMGRPMAFERASVAALDLGRYEINAIGLLAKPESVSTTQDEIERLRGLIIAWADAEDARDALWAPKNPRTQAEVHAADQAIDDTLNALRRAVGR